MIITRRQHPLLKELRDLRDHFHPDLIFLEGPKLIEEALQAKVTLQTVVTATDFKDSTNLLGRLQSRVKEAVTVSDSIFRSFSDLVEPQGILVIGERPRWSWEHLLKNKPAPIIILDGLQNPGNVSAVVRTAEAAGAAGVITTAGTARLTSPKALRGASGSVLRVPNLEHQKPEEIMKQLTQAGYTFYAADKVSDVSHAYTHLDWTQPIAVIMGQEGNGVSEGWTAEVVTIPMEKPVESLNVGAAAAILLYEAARQRRALR